MRKQGRRQHWRGPRASLHQPGETRWGTTPLARAFGGMLQGLWMGGFMAALSLAVGMARMAAAGASPDTAGLRGDLVRFAGGWLVAGAAAGALAPVRHRMGGRRAQGIVLAAVCIAVWTPILDRDAQLGPAESVAAWAVFSVIFGLMIARLFAALDPDPSHTPVDDLDPEPRSGRHRKFR